MKAILHQPLVSSNIFQTAQIKENLLQRFTAWLNTQKEKSFLDCTEPCRAWKIFHYNNLCNRNTYKECFSLNSYYLLNKLYSLELFGDSVVMVIALWI
jgi:hypothetical protein